MEEIIYGIHAVQSFIDYNNNDILYAYILGNNRVSMYSSRLQGIYKQLKIYGCNIKIVNRKFLDKKTNGSAHQGVAICIRVTKKFSKNYLENLLTKCHSPLLLVLDRIVDPHNLGSCLRCADAAGVHAVIIPKNKSAPLNNIAKKVASGAAENVPLIRVTNLVYILKLLYQKYNIRIVGADSKSKNFIYENKLTVPLALVVGSEQNGIRHIVKKCCNELVSIPMIGKISSLNVSVSTGICLYEIVRQNKLKLNII